jgi:DNA uptake protein ComE-like DNA-binding protein
MVLFVLATGVSSLRAADSIPAAVAGIGPKTAAKIIAARPLKNLQDLDNVPGIGAKTIEAAKELVGF